MEAAAATAAPAGAADARALAGPRSVQLVVPPAFDAVYDYVLRIVGDRDLAAAAVRETFARAWRAFPEQGNDVAAWLFTTARTCALQSLRLPREEYSLLALETRHDLTAEAIGEQLGHNGAVSARLSRTREAFDERVSFRLVAERARHTCTALEILVVDADDRELAQHIRGCERCRESTRAFVSPAEVLGSLAPIAPAPGLRREIFKGGPRSRLFGML